MLAAVLVALGLLYTFGFVRRDALTSDQWSRLEEVARSVKVPEGFDQAEVVRSGGGSCTTFVLAGCGPTSITVSYRSPGASSSCEQLATAAAAVNLEANPSVIPRDCVVTGRLDSLAMQMSQQTCGRDQCIDVTVFAPRDHDLPG